MTMFGLKESEVATLVRAVSRDDLDRPGIEERFARATWTGMAEPGDGMAGVLVTALGPARALAAVVEHRSAADIAREVGDPDGEVPEVPEVRKALERWMPRLSSSGSLEALRLAVRCGARLSIPGDVEWPDAVDDLGVHAPLALWVRGDGSAMGARSIALVGARAATGYGEHVAMEASAGLVDRGYAIVSGAAYGIDGMAHRAALASHGVTVAFLAGGVDRFYPSGHDALLARIVECGAVVSELPCGSVPTRWRFLQRNRLIAASSLATIVLEAGWRSGSLNTAGHAAQLGRPLGAVPGPVTSAASAGCHRLIREYGAICVTGPDEMAELAPLPSGPSDDDEADPGADGVAGALSTRVGRTVDELAARSGLTPAEVRSELGRLELEGGASETALGWRKAAVRRA